MGTVSEDNFGLGSQTSVDDLAAIMNLQRREETFDDIHSTISRREQIRNSLAKGPSTRSPTSGDNAGELLRLIRDQSSSSGVAPQLSPNKKKSSSRRRNSINSALERKLSKRNASEPVIVFEKDEGDERSTGTSGTLGNSSRQSQRQRRTGSKRDHADRSSKSSRDGRSDRRTSETSRTSTRSETRGRPSSSKGGSSSLLRSSSQGRRSSSVNRLSSAVSTSSQKWTDSVGPIREVMVNDDDVTANSNGPDRRRRERRSSGAGRSSSLRPSSSRRENNHPLEYVGDGLEGLNKSLHDLGFPNVEDDCQNRLQRHVSVQSMSGVGERKSRQDSRGGRRGGTRRSRSAERHSCHQSSTSGHSGSINLQHELDSFMVDIDGKSSIHTGLSSENGSLPDGTVLKTKKTKLDKIHELQAKCERYKKEWSEAAKDKRHYRKELDASKLKVVSLTKQIETHVSETSILQKSLTETMEKLETIQTEQLTENANRTIIEKALAEAKLNHVKSVNDSRELQAKLGRVEAEIKEKDRQISNLEDDLEAAKANVENLVADLLYADEQISKLENDIKRIEAEVSLYRDAAEREGGEQSDAKLREVREEMEKRLFAEKENRLEEKQRKFEEKMKQFEEERERFLEQLAKKEQAYMEQLAEEGEKLKTRDEDRQKLDNEINERLKKLGEDNAALQGRLKSEQLDAAAKLRNKDESIEKLLKEVAQLKEEASSSGVLALQQEVDLIKSSSETTQAELEDAAKQNKMLQEEVNELKLLNTEMKTWVVTLEDATKDQKKVIDSQKAKLDEWHRKAGDWSVKTHQWKEKAEMWEKKAKSLDLTAVAESASDERCETDPQSLFLAAAVEKKKAAEAGNAAGGAAWKFGGIFKKSSAENTDDAQTRIEELEVENAKQVMEIKTLKSDIVQMQTAFKQEAYILEQEVEALIEKKEALELKNVNLLKELDLARKLNKSMSASEDA